MNIMEALDHIMVFKTNIRTEADIRLVGQVLDDHPLVERWNVDLMDVDCVLRIESHSLVVDDIVELIRQCHYECSELPD